MDDQLGAFPEERLRVTDDRPPHRHPLPLPAGELGGPALQLVGHAVTPTPWSPATKATTCRATSSRVGAERPHADHRVGQIGVDGGAGRQVEVDGLGAQCAAQRGGAGAAQVDVVDGAEGCVAGTELPVAA
jgi:hypothetical protein